MTFADFSRRLSQIESTAKRLEITRYLADLIQVARADVREVVYLSLGQLAPLYAAIDFGLAEKMVLRAIALAFETDLEVVRNYYQQIGDLGKVAKRIAENTKSSGKAKPAVTQVFNQLMDIAGESGEKSQQRKLQKTAVLLRSLDSTGACFAVRIILGTLRLGFSDRTVLDALSLLVSGNKSARAKLERVYNVRPDVGWLAEKVTGNKTQATSLKPIPVIGTPILPALCQRLPSTEELIKKMGEIAVEPKWDGQRIQAHVRSNYKLKTQNSKLAEVKLFTRGLENVTHMFPDLANPLEKLVRPSSFGLHPSSFILDGEVVGVDPTTGGNLPFQTTITRKRKYGVQEHLLSVPIKYMVFDLLMLNNKSLMNQPFSQRRETLEKLLRHQSDKLKLAPQLVSSDANKVRKFLEQQIKAGLEGIVAKKLSDPYSPGRTGYTWVKLKWEGEAKAGGLLDTVDCVVMGAYAGRGKRAGFGVGAFLVGVYNHQAALYQTISKIGTGLSDDQWRDLQIKSQKLKVKNQPTEYEVPKALIPDTWLSPELVAEIQADNITKSPLHTAGFALRFPRLVRYRSDKRPDQATTVAEIHQLSQTQS